MINIIANGVWGPEGLSGGDTIFIELARFWAKRGVEVNIFTWEDGYEMCQDNKLIGVNYHVIKLRKYKRLGFYLLYLLRAIAGIRKVKKVICSGRFANRRVVVYSASDFYPDSIPGYFFKRYLKRAKWVGSLYLFAPNPVKGFRASYKRKITFPRLGNIAFYLSQKPIFWLVAKFADLIFVTSEPDVKPFVSKGRNLNDIFVVKGGIDFQHISSMLTTIPKTYDACFIGRFHPQKGVLEMIDIWHEVCWSKPSAKLAVIGLGNLEVNMKEKISGYGLQDNIEFLGTMTGDDKLEILQKSRVVLHPAVYDSGGMAACAGLACGLPGICFELESLKTYYHQGFLRAPVGDIKAFSEHIINLLDDKELYDKMTREAIEEAKTWDWKQRGQRSLERIEALFSESNTT